MHNLISHDVHSNFTIIPVILVGDELIDISSTNLGKERSTWEECMDYICTEFDEVADILPEQQETT